MSIALYSTTKNLTTVSESVIDQYDYVYQTTENTVDGTKSATGRVITRTNTVKKVFVLSGTFATSLNLFNQDGDNGGNVSAVASGSGVPANHVQVTGDNSASTDIYEDIRVASVAGSWGIHSAVNVYTTQLNCMIWLGGREQSASTIVKTQDERVYVTDGIVSTANATYPNTYTQGVGAYKEENTNPSVVLLDADIYFDENTTSYLYAGSLISNTFRGCDFYFVGETYTCSQFSFIGFAAPQINSNWNIDRSFFENFTGLLVMSLPNEVTAMTIQNCDFALFFAYMGLTTAINNVTFIGSGGSLIGVLLATLDISLIDCIGDDVSGSGAIFALQSTITVRKKKTINHKVSDYQNNKLQNATVTYENKNLTQSFSVQTDANGDIAEQTVEHYTRYAVGNGSGVLTTDTKTDYNDFYATIRKSGYKSQQRMKHTISKPIDCQIHLAKIKDINASNLAKIMTQ